mgnify:CR=1 FL=1
MIFLLFGQDTFRLKRKLSALLERYKNTFKEALELKVIDLAEKDFRDFKNAFESVSMFKERKLLIVKNAQENSQFKEEFLKRISIYQSSPEIILFIQEGEIPDDEFFEKIKKAGKFQEFKPLEGYKLKAWVEEEIKKYGAKIEKRALEKLIEYVGNDLWQIDNEIKKLISYKRKREILLKDVELLVQPKIEAQIFKTIETIANKQKEKALKMLRFHLEKGEKASYIFTMIKYQFKTLLIVKDFLEKGFSFLEIQNKTDLHPYVIKKTSILAKKFKTEELLKIYQALFEIDLKMKMGKIEPEMAIFLFVSQV